MPQLVPDEDFALACRFATEDLGVAYSYWLPLVRGQTPPGRTPAIPEGASLDPKDPLYREVVKSNKEQWSQIYAFSPNPGGEDESELGVPAEQIFALARRIRARLAEFGEIDVLPAARFGSHCFRKDPPSTLPVVLRFLDEDSMLLPIPVAKCLARAGIIRTTIPLLIGKGKRPSRHYCVPVPYRYASYEALLGEPSPRIGRVGRRFGVFCNEAFANSAYSELLFPLQFLDPVEEYTGVTWEWLA